MPIESPEKVMQQLKQSVFAPVYFLCGQEPYFIDWIADYVQDQVLPEHEKGFNQTLMYGKDLSMSDVISNARRFPMMAERQVIIVKESQDIKDWGKEDANKRLLGYLDNPSPTTLLLFAYKHSKISLKSGLGKKIAEKAICIDSQPLYDNKIPAWVTAYVKGKGHSIHPKAAQLLADYIGNNLERISKEVDKILINFKEAVEIDTEVVQNYVGISKEYNIFELYKSLSTRNTHKIFQIFYYFEANQKAHPPYVIIAQLYGYFTKVLLLHQNKKLDQKALATLIGVNPYFLAEYRQAAQHFTVGKCVQIISYLRQADLQVKGVEGINDLSQIYKELVFKMLY